MTRSEGGTQWQTARDVSKAGMDGLRHASCLCGARQRWIVSHSAADTFPTRGPPLADLKDLVLISLFIFLKITIYFLSESVKSDRINGPTNKPVVCLILNRKKDACPSSFLFNSFVCVYAYSFLFLLPNGGGLETKRRNGRLVS